MYIETGYTAGVSLQDPEIGNNLLAIINQQPASNPASVTAVPLSHLLPEPHRPCSPEAGAPAAGQAPSSPLPWFSLIVLDRRPRSNALFHAWSNEVSFAVLMLLLCNSTWKISKLYLLFSQQQRQKHHLQWTKRILLERIHTGITEVSE